MNSKWARVLFPVIYGLCIYTSIRLVNDVISGTRFWLRSWTLNAIEIGGSIAGSYLVMYMLNRQLAKNQRKYTGAPHTGALLREFAEVALYIELLASFTIIPIAAF